MSLFDCRAQFEAGHLDKQKYIDEMYSLHMRLFDYARYIKNTDISSINIQDDLLIMTMRSNGIKLIYEMLDKRAAPLEILNFNFYEQKDSDMLFKLINPDDVIFDVGANIGWYSISIAKLYKSIDVHAFEPIPKTYDLLNKNILLNNQTNIKTYDFGFSDNNHDIEFYYDEKLAVNASSKNLTGNPHLQKIISQVMKLDDFFVHNKINKLDFIKCDVEGAELMVYKGGINTIKKYKPIIFTEMLRKWSAKFDYHPNEIIDLFNDLGYQCFTAENSHLIEFNIMDENTIETNFFFLHKTKHASKIFELRK